MWKRQLIRLLTIAFTIPLLSCGGDGATEVEVPVPEIAISAESASFEAGVLGPDPPAQSLDITNAAAGPLDGLSATIDYEEGQPEGWLTATLSGTSGPASLSLAPGVGDLPAGTYDATVTVAASGASNTPRTVGVTLELAHHVDQEYTPTHLTVFAGGSSDKAQTFIVGVSGTLTQVDLLMISQYADVELEIRATNSGVPAESNSVMLYSETIPQSRFTGEGYYSYPLAGGIPVQAGQVLAITMRSSATFQWNGTNNDGYADGMWFFRSATSPTWTAGVDVDHPFRTYVTPH